MTLTEFLLARIGEDEARYVTAPYDRNGSRASRIHFEDCPSLDEHRPYPCECGLVARVLAECEAKRRIVETEWNDPWNEGARILALLAVPYADHPDYREEWRP